jgi:hypothetical protein
LLAHRCSANSGATRRACNSGIAVVSPLERTHLLSGWAWSELAPAEPLVALGGAADGTAERLVSAEEGSFERARAPSSPL